MSLQMGSLILCKGTGPWWLCLQQVFLSEWGANFGIVLRLLKETWPKEKQQDDTSPKRLPCAVSYITKKTSSWHFKSHSQFTLVLPLWVTKKSCRNDKIPFYEKWQRWGKIINFLTSVGPTHSEFVSVIKLGVRHPRKKQTNATKNYLLSECLQRPSNKLPRSE